MKCPRCNQESIASTMSIFNTEIVCLECKGKEENHPKHDEARAAELAAVRAGDLNFPGIGLPPDLAPKQKFEMGRLVMTTALQEDLKKSDTEKGWHDEINLLVSRHLSGDFGDMDDHDTDQNKAAIESGEDRVFSSYTTNKGIKLWIITEWDRSITTVLRPEDY